MTGKPDHAFVVMRGERFLKFGSYRSAYETDSPLSATLYRRRSEAEKRLTGGAYVYGEKHDDLRVEEIEATWKVVSA